MTTKAKDLIARGRTTAVKTFTRFNNLSIEPRSERQARTLSIVTNRGCVAYSKDAPISASTSVRKSGQPRPSFSTSVKAPLALAFTLVLTALLFHSAPADAAARFTYEPARSEALGTFVQPRTLTFDAAGNLYVADPAHVGGPVIDKFDEENGLVEELGSGILTGNATRGVAVNDETGHVYVADSNNDELFVLDGLGKKLSVWNGAGGGGAPSGTFGTNCCFIYDAVDNSGGPGKGQVYVSSENNGGEVVVLEPQGEDKEEGKYVRSLEVPPGGFIGADPIAVNDSSGAEAGVVYVVNVGNKVVDRFSAQGVFESRLTGPSPTEPFVNPSGVAVEAETGNVWVTDQAQPPKPAAVYELSPAGTLLGKITQAGGEPLESPTSVAVRSSGPRKGEVYITEPEKHRIDVFGLEVAEKPVLSEAGVSQLTGDSALLSAQVNPHGASTAYTLEYGRCETAETCALAPYQLAGEGSLGSEEDFSPHTVSAPVQGLTQSTTYHLRVVAHNSKGQSVEEVTFTTQGAGGELVLPDDRMWELASPPDKHGGLIAGIAEEGVIEAAAGGGAISYLANAPIEEGAQGNVGPGVQALSRRGTGGWSSSVIASPHERTPGGGTFPPEYRFFSDDLAAAIVQPFGLFNPGLSGEASEQTPYLRTLGGCTGGCYHPLVSAKPGFANVPEGTHFGEERTCVEDNGLTTRAVVFCGPRALGATGDLAHAVFSSEAPLKQGAPREGLYEWSTAGLQLISVLPENGAGEELPASAGTAKLGYIFGEATGSARRAISSDGGRVFWSTSTEIETTKALYVRETVLGRTLQLDKAEAACGEACESGAGRFQIASADGSRAFFTDEHKLTRGAGASAGSPDLYECRISVSAGRPVCVLTDLTPETGGEKAGVQGNVLGAGEDGEDVYFVAKGTLAAGQNARGEAPAAGQANLFVRKSGQTSFVAVLSGGDRTDWELAPEDQPTRVSPNGRFLAFMSERPLSGYDNHDALSGQLDAEVFLYDAESGRTVCASCDPTGQRPTGIEYHQLESGHHVLATVSKLWPSDEWVAALVPQATKADPDLNGGSAYQSRYLSSSGRMFFNALGGLVPQDVNGIGDVYEHEPLGIKGPENEEDCTTSMSTFSERDGGCLSLISSGVSSRQSQFLDASENGDDVFFLTNAKLAPQDVDANEDIYDAHVCSAGSPCISPPASPPVCRTEASCKAAPTPQPGIFGAPPSATFNGLGNVTPAPAVKAKAKPPTRAQKLAAALKVCHKKAKAKRGGCEKTARKEFGPLKKSKKKTKK
jgi:DNA-binding beta-propeller fold protein YncE